MVAQAEILDWQARIEQHAQDFGLDFFPTVFQMVTFEQMNEIAAYGGFPTRYPHWTFGMEHERLAKSYAYGLSKIYELVVNTNPCYAYLLECNPLVDQKLVMAHVYGHCDFFKNNLYFAHTNRKMMDELANHGMRIRRYMSKHGFEAVESLLDDCQCVDNLIDLHSTFIKRRVEVRTAADLFEERERQTARRLPASDYMERYINPPDFVAEQERKLVEEETSQRRLPERPERDVLLFLLEHAPLDNWQREVLALIREEAYYFAPQGQTKIMNEGWASFVHSNLMTKQLATDAEIVDYAEHHSGTMGRRPGSLNPYKLGLELLRDIEARWDKGQFGKEWDECDDFERRRAWDTGAGLGRQKLFEVRKLYSDVTFIDEFLTPEFCAEQGLFAYDYDDDDNLYRIASRQFPDIKRKLLFQLTNFGQPHIAVMDANHENRGELYLKHDHEGLDLKMREARDTLHSLYRLWKRPVHLETVVDDWNVVLTFTGSEDKDEKLREVDD